MVGKTFFSIVYKINYCGNELAIKQIIKYSYD